MFFLLNSISVLGQVEDGLVSYYSFDGNAIDGSGSGNNGVIYGTNGTPDRFGNSNGAIHFDGIDDFISVEESPSLQLEYMSICTWVKLDDIGRYLLAVKSSFQNANGEQFALSFLDDVFEFSIKRESGCNPGVGWQRVRSRIVTNNSDWIFIVGTWDGSIMKMYFNGELDSLNAEAPGGALDVCLGAPIRFGKQWSSDEMFLDGSLDAVRIYNRAITPSEIQQLYTENTWDNPTTRLVPSIYPSIQSAILASVSGDTVLVSPGIYNENIDFSGKSIVLGSLFLTTNDTSYITQTIIDGSDQDRVVIFNDGENTLTRLSGFTIQNGNTTGPGDFPSGFGGGIFIGQNCSPTLDHLTVKSSNAQYSGGGIHSYGSPIYQDLTVKNNQSGTSGGGLSFQPWSWAQVINCEIINNQSNSGAGISITGDGNNIWLKETIIADNFSENRGAGIYFSSASQSSYLNLTNCTISNNEVTNATTGGGIYTGSNLSIIGENTIIWGNSPNSIGQGDGTVTVDLNYSQIEGGWPGTSNSNLNPLFDTMSANPYSLLADSPCIDTGNPDLDSDGEYWDIDAEDQDPDGTRLDIGAFYYDQSPPSLHISELNPAFSLPGNMIGVYGYGFSNENISVLFNGEVAEISGLNDNFFNLITPEVGEGYAELIVSADGLISASPIPPIVLKPDGGQPNLDSYYEISVHPGLRNPVWGDLDSDGDQDVVVITPDDNRILWFDNTGDILNNPNIIDASFTDPLYVQVADIDGDSDLDVIASSFWNHELAWYENTGSGEFGPKQIISSTLIQPGLFTVGDIDSDGDNDIVITEVTIDKILIFRNASNLGFEIDTLEEYLSGAWQVSIADLDADSDMDIICSSNDDGRIVWYANLNNSGNYASAITIHLPSSGDETYYSISDLDTDGDLDIVFSTRYRDEVRWLENLTGDASGFGNQQLFTGAGTHSNYISVFDVNNDGVRDIILAQSLSGGIWICLGDADTLSFSSRTQIPNSSGSKNYCLVDLDGDGDVDIVGGGESLKIFTNNIVPWAPRNLQLSEFPDRLVIHWSPNSEYDLQSYNIYRGISPSADEYLATIPVGESTSFSDFDVVNGIQYSYKMEAIDSLGNASDFSAVVSGRNSGETIHVSIDGSDESGDGSFDLPYQTIQWAVSVCSIQDTVILLPGDYEIESPIVFPEFPIIITSSEGFTSTSIIGSQYPVLLNNNNTYICSSTISGISFEGFIHIAQSIQYLPRFSNCKFTNNQYSGGGLFDIGVSDSTAKFDHCVFALNTATNSQIDGLFTGSNFYVNFTNCSFAWNANGIFRIDYGGVTFNNCIVRTGLGAINQTSKQANYSFIEYPDEFNFSSMYECIDGQTQGSPGFVDEAGGNLMLLSNSICIDAGNPDFDGDGNTWETDIDDQDPDGTRLDMGALYFNQIEYSGPVWYVSTDGSDETGNGSTDYPFETLQSGIDHMMNGDTLLLLPGIYYQSFNSGEKSITIKGEMGSGNTFVDFQNFNSAETNENIFFVAFQEAIQVAIEGITFRNKWSDESTESFFYLRGETNYPLDIQLKDVVFKDNLGQAINMSHNVSLEIDTCLFMNNSVAGVDGGAIKMGDAPSTVACSLVINSSGFMDNSAKKGGAIAAEDGYLQINNSSFDNNNGTNNGPINYGGGGALFIDDSCTALIQNTTFIQNISQSAGGAISVNNHSSATISYSSVIHNEAAYGGGIATGTNANLTLLDCDITENDANYDGGGAYQFSNSTVHFENVQFTNNTSLQKGGGIGSDNCFVTINNCRIISNQATAKGGGVWASDGEVRINRTFIKNNITSDDGGGLASHDGTIVILDSTEVRGNTAGLEGGGFYLHNNDSVRFVYLNISDNQATNNGGGIVLRGFNNNPYFQNLTVTNNTALNTAEILDYANSSTYINCILWHSAGGGVDIDHQYEAEYSFMPENVGSGVNTGDVGTISNLDPQFAFPDTGNYALLNASGCIDTGDPDLDGDGESWETDIDDQDPDGTRLDIGALYFNQIEYSGPVWYVSTDGSDEIGSGSEDSPFATIQRGIQYSNQGDTILVGRGTFLQPINIQSKSLYIIGVDSAETIISADYVYSQSHLVGQLISFQDLRFESNGAGNDYMAWAECTDCSGEDSIQVQFLNVYADGSNEKGFLLTGQRTKLDVTNSQFNNFEDSPGDGAVLKLDGGTTIIEYSTFSNNSVSGKGGTIYCLGSGSLNINNCEFNENNSTGDGGAIFLSEGTMSIRETSFIQNSASRGGAIHSREGATVFISNSTFESNQSVYVHATDGGGAISLNTTSLAEIYSSQFFTNSSSSDGGAIDANESILNMSHNVFINNFAGGDGQAISLDWEASVFSDFCTFSDNGSIPGSIVMTDGSTFMSSNSILWGTQNFQIIIAPSSSACSLDVSYSVIKNGQLGIQNQSSNLNFIWGAGNIPTDPHFSSSTLGSLSVISPCIDAGEPDHDGDGDTWEIDTDDQDPDGTRLDMGALYFNQTDSLSPSVTLNFPDIIDEPKTGDTLQISWVASDNNGLDWAKIWFSLDGGESYIPSDSVDANWGQLDWIVPDVISDSCRLAILVSDFAGNVSGDTLATLFSIEDGTNPFISISNPSQNTMVRENDTLHVEWDASDNIGIQSFQLWYSNNPNDPFENLEQISAEDTIFDFVIGEGVSDSARIKMDVFDVAGNIAEDYSEYFSISDNTSPFISYFSIPDTSEWGIGSIIDIGVVATDNVEITGLDLNYSTDNGSNWLPIVDDLYPVQGRPTHSWLIPDIPGECQIQAVVSDAVGLTDTSYSEVFTIYIEYPRMIASLPEIRPDGDMHLKFSQMMDSLDISSGTQVVGSVHGAYSISGLLNGDDLIITADEGFVSLDTLQVVLTSSLWTNSFGYGLDGNGNGVYDGNSIDNDTSYTIVTAAGDYDQNGLLDFDDFDDFVIAWNNDVTEYELAPHQGDIPYINIQPDSSFDIYDLATFALMWNWAAGISLSAPLTESFSYAEFISEQNGNELEVSLPLCDYVASQTIIKYDPTVVQIIVADDGLAKVSSSGLSMLDVNPDSGFILITSSQLTDSYDDDLHLKLFPDTKQRYSVEIAFQGSDMDANVVQKRSLVELLPIPTNFSLSQNYPNPFNASTTIEYGLPKDSDLSISIYDIRGRFVRDIYSGEKEAGYHVTRWNGSNDVGQNVASGLYFIVINTQEYRAARKALILK